MILKAPIGLLGDTVNLYGIIRDLSELHDLSIIYPDEAKWFYDIINPTIDFKRVDDTRTHDAELNLSEAFKYAPTGNYHMSQAYHIQFGLPTPAEPIRPELEIADIEVPIYDYILAPFSRSLPDEQKWSWHKWQEVGWRLQDQGYTVCIFGNSKYDGPIFGITNEYDRLMNEVLNMIKKCKQSVISVITGISHLTYAMNTQNILLSGQYGNWGRNPDAFEIQGNVSDFTVEQVLRTIHENRL